MKRCMKCGFEEFCVDAHVVQNWLVDTNGEYIATMDKFVAVSHAPNDDDIWVCKRCGHAAIGYAFNVEEGDEGI